jgi:hypothetical protein
VTRTETVGEADDSVLGNIEITKLKQIHLGHVGSVHVAVSWEFEVIELAEKRM